jgi:hypothetical protein
MQTTASLNREKKASPRPPVCNSTCERGRADSSADFGWRGQGFSHSLAARRSEREKPVNVGAANGERARGVFQRSSDEVTITKRNDRNARVGGVFVRPIRTRVKEGIKRSGASRKAPAGPHWLITMGGRGRVRTDPNDCSRKMARIGDRSRPKTGGTMLRNL